jgi:hypothetical protein
LKAYNQLSFWKKKDRPPMRMPNYNCAALLFAYQLFQLSVTCEVKALTNLLERAMHSPDLNQRIENTLEYKAKRDE